MTDAEKVQSKVPQLRFPEFSGGWEKSRLGDVATFLKGKGISKADTDPEGKLECIRYGELYTHYDELIERIRSKTNLDKKSLVLSKEGDVIIPASGESALDIATASCVKKEGVAYSGDLNVLRSSVNGLFLAYYLNNKRKHDIARYAQGASVIHLYATQMKSLLLWNPKDSKENDKIASFVATVDKKISLLKQKHEQLVQYKKGIMQQLFSQQLRFKDDNGQGFPDWKVRPMSEVLELVIREVPKPEEKYLALGVRSHMKGTFQKPDFNPNDIAMERLYSVKENDLIVNITFAWEGAIAIVKKEDEGGLVSHRFPTYVFKDGEATHRYFKHIIQEKRFKYLLDLISPGGAGRNRVLSKKEFLKLKWNLPEIDEQNKIADFLGAIDQKINLAQQQIEQTQTYKQGLLQQMFV
ncbi:restriction endonuclease subunit S [Neptuniibacter marinus]|uniref:restriction endonuclease subunit S n=1 Tax=Neptuniibacter marinus TaxID=1806670 RepID=UPI003B59D2A6